MVPRKPGQDRRQGGLSEGAPHRPIEGLEAPRADRRGSPPALIGLCIQKDEWRLIWICPFEPPRTVWIM